MTAPDRHPNVVVRPASIDAGTGLPSGNIPGWGTFAINGGGARPRIGEATHVARRNSQPGLQPR